MLVAGPSSQSCNGESTMSMLAGLLLVCCILLDQTCFIGIRRDPALSDEARRFYQRLVAFTSPLYPNRISFIRVRGLVGTALVAPL